MIKSLDSLKADCCKEGFKEGFKEYLVATLKRSRNKKTAKERILCWCLVTAYILAVRGRTLQTPIARITNLGIRCKKDGLFEPFSLVFMRL